MSRHAACHFFTCLESFRHLVSSYLSRNTFGGSRGANGTVSAFQGGRRCLSRGRIFLAEVEADEKDGAWLAGMGMGMGVDGDG